MRAQPYSLRCYGGQRRYASGVEARRRSKPFVISQLDHDHESLTSPIGNESRKDLRQWINPTDPSTNFCTASEAHHKGTAAWCTEGKTFADWMASGSLLWIHGKRKYTIIAVLIVAHGSWIDSWLREDRPQVRYTPGRVS